MYYNVRERKPIDVKEGHKKITMEYTVKNKEFRSELLFRRSCSSYFKGVDGLCETLVITIYVPETNIISLRNCC